jgi:uncharacterized protein YehS (DUF1456 family)
MTNNDILRRIRYVFDLKDAKMIKLFSLAEHEVTREQISAWLKKDDDDNYKSCSDVSLAIFLNGFINDKRGKKDGPQIAPEEKLTNNIILRKLKIALDFTSDDIIRIMDLAGLSISASELSAFFRKVGHKHYRECKDQFLRNFLQGLQIHHRGESNEEEQESDFAWKTP